MMLARDALRVRRQSGHVVYDYHQPGHHDQHGKHIVARMGNRLRAPPILVRWPSPRRTPLRCRPRGIYLIQQSSLPLNQTLRALLNTDEIGWPCLGAFAARDEALVLPWP